MIRMWPAGELRLKATLRYEDLSGVGGRHDSLTAELMCNKVHLDRH